ncbi:hypothetical protein [Streptomyces camelliae]|uniref:Uncharacterized protein n=1 Tax=Streptomyces camelliae TaxID=3004093 RepID=A0ABY7NUC2_9ACTN|nr:hypothetical protein [Streptomyces sp. HUAS 2-6]WBO61394.1 hypothetical protein O1G22_00065 [Streptomyces sp. HUAS 2-6]
MSGALTRAMHTLDQYALASDKVAKTSTTMATGASSTTTVVLTVAGLLVTVVLAVIGWIILDTHRTRDRTADVGNHDLNALIAQLRAADVEARRIHALACPANGDHFREITRLASHLESHGAQFPAPLSVLVADAVQDISNLIALPVDNSTAIGEYGVRVQQ